MTTNKSQLNAIAAAVLLSLIGTASAEWVLHGSTGNYTTYVDSATIRRNANFVKMWVLNDYKVAKSVSGKSYLSAKVQREFDCDSERERLVAFLMYSQHMAGGSVVGRESVLHTWQPVAPGSTGEFLWKFACGKK